MSPNDLTVLIGWVVLVLLALLAIYVIVRMLINRRNGRDELDGLL